MTHLLYLPVACVVSGAAFLWMVIRERREYRCRQRMLQRLRDEHLGQVGWDGPDRKGLGTDGR